MSVFVCERQEEQQHTSGGCCLTQLLSFSLLRSCRYSLLSPLNFQDLAYTHTFTHLVVLLKCPQSGEDDECRQESRLMEVM